MDLCCGASHCNRLNRNVLICLRKQVYDSSPERNALGSKIQTTGTQTENGRTPARTVRVRGTFNLLLATDLRWLHPVNVATGTHRHDR